MNGIEKGAIVLVTGATGFTGSVLVKKLAATGAHVRAIARHSSKTAHLENLGIEWFRGDVYDEKVVEAATQGVSYIFHVAAAYREAKIKDEDYYLVHVKSTQLLAEHALRQPNFKRFVHVSTIGVHGHIDHPPADENYRFSPGDIYQETKVEGEVWFREFAKKNNLPFTVIRPAGIFGPGDKRLLKVFKMGTKPLVPVLGFGKCLYHLIHVEDLTEGMILAATHPKALGEVFICGNKEQTSLFEMIRIVSKEFGKKTTTVRLPVTPFLLLGDICEFVCKPFGIEPPIYRRRVSFYTKDRSFDTRKIRERLGFSPRSNEQGLKETALWYKEQGWV